MIFSSNIGGWEMAIIYNKCGGVDILGDKTAAMN